MNIIDIKEELERVDRLIRLKATGSPKDLADKLCISERHVYRIINQLKDIGCPVYFNKERGSYCYSDEGKLIFKFEQETIGNEYLKSLKGGKKQKYLNLVHTDIICQWENITLH